MLNHAIKQHATAIAPNDLAFWRKRIQWLKAEIRAVS